MVWLELLELSQSLLESRLKGHSLRITGCSSSSEHLHIALNIANDIGIKVDHAKGGHDIHLA